MLVSEERDFRVVEFADEVLALLSQVPTPSEVLVERLGFLRHAEAEGRFDQTLTQLRLNRAAPDCSPPRLERCRLGNGLSIAA